MNGIVKRFPGVVANDHVNFELRAGEVHGLLGENGAGKTTLMNVLYGILRPEEGEICMPREAINLGIGMVHQHFKLVEPHTVLIFSDDWRTILEAYWSRGVDVNKGSLIQRLRNYVSVVIPLMVITLNKVKEVDFSAESRGFKLGVRNRTYIDRFRWTPADSFITAGSVLAIAIVLVLAFQGRLSVLSIAL